MKKTLLHIFAIAALLAGAAVLPGCDDEASDGAPTASAATSAQAALLPEGFVLASAPDGARGVAETRSAAQEGETVVVRGVIGGREEPIAPNRAILTLLDESVKTCDRMSEDDGCKTPWDACCEAPEVISANSLAVQVVDAQGRVLEGSLAGAGGLAPLSRVVVVGRYRPSPDGQAAVLEATRLYVEKAQ